METERPKVGIGILVIKKQGDTSHVMLHKRKKASLGKDYWGSGGGHLELGESLEAGALRELREEAGPSVVVKNVKFLAVSNFTDFPPNHYVDISFVADWVSGEPVNTEPEKMTEWQWFSLSDLPNPLFPPLKKYFLALRTNHFFFDSSFADKT